MNDEVIINLKNYLVNRYNCHSIILYGSYANGTQTKESDIDVICFSDNINPQNDTSKLLDIQLDAWIYPTEKMDNYEDLIHINDGIIVLNKKSICNQLMNNISYLYKEPIYISENEVNFNKSWLIKTLSRAKKEDTEGNFRYHLLLTQSLEIYFQIIKVRYMGSKKSLEYLKNKDTEAFRFFEKALSIKGNISDVENLINFITSS